VETRTKREPEDSKGEGNQQGGRAARSSRRKSHQKERETDLRVNPFVERDKVLQSECSRRFAIDGKRKDTRRGPKSFRRESEECKLKILTHGGKDGNHRSRAAETGIGKKCVGTRRVTRENE